MKNNSSTAIFHVLYQFLDSGAVNFHSQYQFLRQRRTIPAKLTSNPKDSFPMGTVIHERSE